MANNFRWSARSRRELAGIHPDLRKVTDLALKYSPLDFIITDGLRTKAEQREYVRRGVSKTMNSRHLTGHAVDFVALVNGKVKYEYKPMKAVADAFKKAAAELGVKIKWGGDWKNSWDTPHIELDRRYYK
jgi:peptidoglycan LD-endopeptidase CwlK